MKKRTKNNVRDKLLVSRDDKAKQYPLFAPKKKGDVGFDLTSTEDVIIPSGVNRPPTEIPTGIKVKLPKGTFAIILPRSGTYSKFPELFICSAPIDNGYTGPLNPRFKNLGVNPVLVEKGDRIAQLVVLPAIVPDIIETEELEKTERGESRYGSTGRK